MAEKTLFILGLQNFSLVDFVRIVKEQDVFRIVDIRGKNKISHGRKPFSPEQLQSILSNINVDYVRMPEVALSNDQNNAPSENGHRAEYIKEYIRTLSSDKSIVNKVKKYFKDDRVMILCIEEDPYACKRKPFAKFVITLLDEKTKIISLSISDLKPRVIPPLPPLD